MKMQRTILLVALLGFAAISCKTMNNGSETLASSSKTPLTLDLGNSGNVDIDWKKADVVPITVAASKDGLASVELSLYTGDSKDLAKPPKVTFIDGKNKVVEGTMFSYVNSPGYYSAKIVFDAKAKKNYTLTIDHGGVLKGSKGTASAYGSYVYLLKPASYDFGTNQTFELADRFSDVDLPLKFKVDRGGAIAVNISAAIEPITKGLLNPNATGQACQCELTVILKENGKEFPVILKDRGGDFRDSLNYDLQPGEYEFRVKSSKLAGDAIVNLNVYAANSGRASSRPMAVSILQMGFDQANSKAGKLSASPFGFAIDSEIASEGKIDISLNVTRFLNKVDPKKSFPETANFGLFQNTPPTSATTPPIGALGLQVNNGSNYNGAFVWDFEQSKYFLLSNPAAFDPNDQVELRGTMAISDLTIIDGGEPLSAFKDAGQLTVTPPANYADDQDPKATPFPKNKPVDMAMKSVLEAMEQTRNVFHQRVPKGIKRGPTNAIDPNTIEACLGNQAEHWSDIMIHYYCQHGQARACYTNTVRSGSTRKDAFDTCKTDAAFKWVADNQGDVFRYVMFSQTFAFNMEQQQRVINAFYRIDNPSDKSECVKKRPRRAIDPADGTHCLATKVFPSVPMRSLGR